MSPYKNPQIKAFNNYRAPRRKVRSSVQGFSSHPKKKFKILQIETPKKKKKRNWICSMNKRKLNHRSRLLQGHETWTRGAYRKPCCRDWIRVRVLMVGIGEWVELRVGVRDEKWESGQGGNSEEKRKEREGAIGKLVLPRYRGNSKFTSKVDFFFFYNYPK